MNSSQSHILSPGRPFLHEELQVMAQRGFLRQMMGNLHVPVDIADTKHLRAESVRHVGNSAISGQWTATLNTAMWVYLGGPAPLHLDAAIARYQLPKSRVSQIPLSLRQSNVATVCHDTGHDGDSDVVLINGLRCTSVERTIEDRLRLEPTHQDLRYVQQMLGLTTPDKLRKRFALRRRLPQMISALEHLETLLA